jgi:tRNA(Arg) A34 adenosine deaminase TadA
MKPFRSVGLTVICLVASAFLFAAAPVALPDDPACTAADRPFMERAYEMARLAVQEGTGRPFGAVLVLDGKIIAEFHNCELGTHDPTKHAETGLISAFGAKIDRATFARTMCCGAIRFAGIRRVVYGTTETQFERIIGYEPDAHPLDSREVFARTAPQVKVIGPLMEAEGLAIHEAYWPTIKLNH